MFSSASSVEVAVGEDERSHQGPHVQRDTDPSGRDLHPHRRPLASHCLVVGVGAGKIDRMQMEFEPGTFRSYFVADGKRKYTNRAGENGVALQIFQKVIYSSISTTL